MGRKIRDAETDPPGLVRDQRDGTFYARRSYSPGPGLNPKDIIKSLGTKQKAEALRRFDVAAASLRTEIEALRRDKDGVTRGRPRTETEEEKGRYWRDVFALAKTTDARNNAEAAFDATIEKVLGEPVGAEADERGRMRETYAPDREAKAAALIGLANGTRVPADFHIEAFLGSRERTNRYDLRIRLAVRKLAEWLQTRPEGNSIRGVTKRTAAHFTDHYATTLKPHTLKGWKSSLSLYWDWMATREEVEGNPWKEVKLDRRLSTDDDRRAFTDEETRKLIDGATDPTMRDFIVVAALSGMRENEIGRLTVSDTEGDWFNVRKSKTKAGVRRVPIHSDLAAIILRRTANKQPGDWLFDDLPPSNGKGRERADKMGERFTEYRRSVGVDERRENGRSNVVFHSFRHWFTTAALNAGAIQPVVSSLVGHAGGLQGMTLGTYYSGPTNQLLIDAVAGVSLPTNTKKEPA